jgi:effector-binding domain-containing protein
MGKQRLVNLYEERPIGVNPASYTQTGTQSQYDTGLLPGMDINEYRADQQTWSDKLGNGMVNMASSAFTGALESTVGLGVGITQALIEGDKSKIWNNEFGQWLDQFNEATRELAPFYQTEEEQNMSLAASLGTSNFWFDKVLGGAGYTIGSLAASYGLSKVFSLAGVASKGLVTTADDAMGILARDASKVSKLGVTELAKQTAIGSLMAHGESAMEARQTYTETLKFLEENNPELTPEQREKYATNAANSNYLMNLAITGPTDMMLLGKWINPGTKRSIAEYNKVASRLESKVAADGATTYFDRLAAQKGRAFLNGSEKFLKGFATEGGQEGGQFASNIAAQEFVKSYNKKDADWFTSITDGLLEGISQTLTSREGQENILIGGIIGGPFGLKGAKAERIAEDLAVKQLVDARNEDPNFTDAGKALGDMFSASLGNDKAIVRKIKSLGIVDKLQKAEQHKLNNEVYESMNEEESALMDYIKLQLDKGTHEFLKTKLSALKEANPKEIAQFFGFDETVRESDMHEKIDKVISKVDEYSKLNDTINRLYGTSSGDKKVQALNSILRDRLFKASATIGSVESRIKSITDRISESSPEGSNIISLRKQAFDLVNNTKLDDLVSQAKESGLDYAKYIKDFREKAFDNYNNSIKKLMANDPLNATAVMEDLADLNRLDGRKKEFVDIYNGLNNPKGVSEILKIENDIVASEKKTEDAIKQSLANVNASDHFTTDPNRSNPVNVSGNDIDLAKTSEDELDSLTESLSIEALSLQNDNEMLQQTIDNQDNNGNRTAVYDTFVEKLDANTQRLLEISDNLNSIEKEKTIREEQNNSFNDISTKLRDAKSISEIKDIIDIANQVGIAIKPGSLDTLIKLIEQTEKDIAKQTAKETVVSNSNIFNGVEELYRMFSGNNEHTKNFNSAKQDPEFRNRLSIKLDKPVAGGETRDYGTKGNINNVLRKVVPYIRATIVYNTEGGTELEIGVLPWYGQYHDIENNKTVVIETLDQKEYYRLFGTKVADHPLDNFKIAARQSAELWKVFADKLGNNNETTISVRDTQKLIETDLSKGLFNVIDANENLTPLDQFKLVHINGTPVIVENATHGLNKFTARALKNNNFLKFENGTTEVSPDFMNAVGILENTAKDPRSGNPLNSKFWALIEEPTGNVDINGVKMVWIPVSAPNLDAKEAANFLSDIKNVRNTIMTTPSMEKETASKLLNELNNKVFISAFDRNPINPISNIQFSFNISNMMSKDGTYPRGSFSVTVKYRVDGIEQKTWFNMNLDKLQTLDDLSVEFNKQLTKLEGRNTILRQLSPLTTRSYRKNPGKFENIDPDNINVNEIFAAMVHKNVKKEQKLRVVIRANTPNIPSVPASVTPVAQTVTPVTPIVTQPIPVVTPTPNITRDKFKNPPSQNGPQGPAFSIGYTNVIKPGVTELFESNLELANIGTQQQYSAYLETIFPDSKVKDIVYHGTNLNFDKFDKIE